ncbi:MAG TPA: hypothetical protein VJ508_14100, partial [Saprospiraceae bacterium]|nr:hypothetical protein [Saprospiraceae bacterium]
VKTGSRFLLLRDTGIGTRLRFLGIDVVAWGYMKRTIHSCLAEDTVFTKISGIGVNMHLIPWSEREALPSKAVPSCP